MMNLIVFLGFVAFSVAHIVPEDYYNPENYPVDASEEDHVVSIPEDWMLVEDNGDESEGEHPGSYIRYRRSLQPGAPNFPIPGSNLPSSVSGNIEKQGQNTIATINAQHKTDKYDVGGTWSKVVRGPGRSKPNFSVGGTYRW
ncbi:coleoptericin [Holotrichia oblita]|uniref:Coleoptericin n=2 Tax=Holotrichia oblita TaxID=644536 RepID=A0ACB9TQX6_HOLOL|nr:coleoptericin [Holotrichia oblita]KAI4469200.1 coleoptericin [Holotrichia oblita]